MNPIYLLLLLLTLVAAAAADKIPNFVVLGKCPAVDENKLWAEQAPNFSKFAGLWYEHSLTTNPYQLIEKCVRNEFSFDDKQFTVKSTGVAADGKLMRRNGQVYPNPLGDPHLTIDYESSFASPFVLLDTDYTNYACAYACVDFNGGYYTDFGFILSRSPNLEDQYVKKCGDAFTNINVDTSRFVKTVQGTDCPYDAQKTL